MPQDPLLVTPNEEIGLEVVEMTFEEDEEDYGPEKET
jgi:hypothetical protein